MLKKAAFSVLMCSIFLLGGCKKITEFKLDYNSTAVIPSTFGTLVPFSVNTPEMETNSSYEFDVNKTDADHVKSIRLTLLNLAITAPSNQTFSFVNSIEVYISSPNHSEVLVASKTDIPADAGTTLSLGIPDQDLKDYIKDSKFTLRLKVVTDETITQDVDVNVQSEFLVNAKIFKSKK